MTFIKQAKNERLKNAEFRVLQLPNFGFTFLAFMSLTVLILTAGCPAEKPLVEPPRIESNEVEPNQVEPDETEPEAEPNEVEPNDVEPNDVEPEAEPNAVEPNVVEPEVEPNEAEPNEVKPPVKVSFHDKCNYILSNFVNDKGMVDYKALKHKRPELTKLLDEFAKLDRKEYNSWPKEDKIAFWTNAYNIQMLKIIVDNYPIESSRWRRLFPTWGPYSTRHIDKNIGGFDKQKFMVMSEEFTLKQIDQRFFCKQFGEPRVFFAISRANLSSPPLRKEPYCGDKLYEQLENQVKRFLSGGRGFRIDRARKRVYLSTMLKPTWYGKEFIGKHDTNKKFKDQQPATRAVLNFISKYISKQDRFFLEREIYAVKYIKYDWTLNGSSIKP